jgi:hypothetical protein
MKIQIEDGDEATLIRVIGDHVLASFYERLNERLERALDEAVRAAVNEQAHLLAVEELRPRIRKVLEGEWLESDRYGDSKRYSLKDMIAGYFKPTSYGGGRSWATELMEKTIAEIMKAEFQPQIEAVRKELRTRLDTILGEKLALAVREAVGLR